MENRYPRLTPTGAARPDDVARHINELRDGRIDNAGTVLIAAGTTTTEIENSLLSPTSLLTFTHMGGDPGADGWRIWVLARDKGRATIGHSSVAFQRTVMWAAFG